MTDVFWNLSEEELLALVIWAEARGEPYDGRRAVGTVILNRLDKNGWFGKTLHEVILKPFQFSCFNISDPQFKKLVKIAQNFEEACKNNITLRSCLWMAQGLLNGTIPRDDKNITHYHTLDCNPKWDDNMVLVKCVGHHGFFKEKTV